VDDSFKNCTYFPWLGDLKLDPPVEKFMLLLEKSFHYLPAFLGESAYQISGSEPRAWRQREEPIDLTGYANLISV